MPGLFDALKEGTLGVFTGSADPRLDPRVGQKEGLISAGLGTLASGSQDPLEALAQGALLGRQVGQATRETALQLQQQAALSEFVQEAGFDREGLTRVFMRTLATGDLDSAKAISEILKSLPDPTDSAVNRQNVSTVVSGAAGAPPDIVERLGEGTPVEVQRDPRTGHIFWESALPSAPPADPFPGGTIRLADEQSPTGYSQFGVRGDGVQVFMGHVAGPSGATGGAQGQINRNLASAMTQAEETLSTVDEQLARPVVSILGNIARSGGVFGALANGALRAVAPEGQMALAAADQWTAATVRLLSGAQMTEVERQGYRAAYLPLANEAPAVQAQKAAARGALAALFGETEEEPTPAELDAILLEAGLQPPSGGDGGAMEEDDGGLGAARARLRGGRPGGGV